MKKINALILFVLLSAAGACYKTGSTDKPKTTTTTTATASPSAEKPSEPTNQTAQTTTGGGSAAEKAVAELEEKVKKDPKDHQSFFQLGKNYQILKSEEKAVGAYQKAIAAKPDFAEANYELGRIYTGKKDYEAALPFLQKAAKVKYTSPEYLIAVADNYRALRRCNDAIPPYGNALGFNDKNPAAYYGMGLCYIELNNRIAASTQVRNLEKLDPKLAKDLEQKIAAK